MRQFVPLPKTTFRMNSPISSQIWEPNKFERLTFPNLAKKIRSLARVFSAGTLTRGNDDDETRRLSCGHVYSTIALSLVIITDVSCSPPNDFSVVAAPKPTPRKPPDLPSRPLVTWYDPALTRHDFGIVLAGTDVSRDHTYRITNTSGRAVRALSAVNRKPCCGDVSPIASTVIEPGQSIEVAVRVKIGIGSGDLVHLAEIVMDGDRDLPVVLLTTATAHARATVDEVRLSSKLINPGRSQPVEYLIRSFGTEGDPPQHLEDRSIRCGLPVGWVGPPSRGDNTEAGICEVRRTLSVTLPSLSEPGPYSVPLHIVNGDGAIIGRRTIDWEVTSALKANPSGLFFTSGPSAVNLIEFVVRCRDNQPFHVLSTTTDVTGLTVEDMGDGKARSVHAMTARLERHGRPESRIGQVVIKTDRVDQPLVKVAVYIASQQDAQELREKPRKSS